jgi:hypothetical protein
MNEGYGNSDLAREYFRVARIGSQEPGKYKHIRRLIREAEKDIPQYFRDHGSLQGLGLPGIGKETVRVCESIMTHGLESASRFLTAAKPDPESAASHRTSGATKFIKRWTEDDPAWSNVVRDLEDRL